MSREIVAIEVGGAIVGGQKNIEVAVSVEVCKGETAADLRSVKAATGQASNVLKPSAAIQKKLRRLRVAHVATDVANGLVDMAIRNCKVQVSVEVDIKEQAAEAKRISGGCANPSESCDIVVDAGLRRAIEANHFVVEIGDGDAGFAGWLARIQHRMPAAPAGALLPLPCQTPFCV